MQLFLASRRIYYLYRNITGKARPGGVKTNFADFCIFYLTKVKKIHSILLESETFFTFRTESDVYTALYYCTAFSTRGAVVFFSTPGFQFLRRNTELWPPLPPPQMTQDRGVYLDEPEAWTAWAERVDCFITDFYAGDLLPKPFADYVTYLLTTTFKSIVAAAPHGEHYNLGCCSE
jgi:hypothetical protein